MEIVILAVLTLFIAISSFIFIVSFLFKHILSDGMLPAYIKILSSMLAILLIAIEIIAVYLLYTIIISKHL